jgi:diacylglycerol O-acyltransferase / wax synthase
MADPLSAADRSSLVTERPPINMAIGGLTLVERGPGVTYDAICRRIAERIHLLPRYRQRLQEPALGSLGLTSPVWVDDEHFDVEWHVRPAMLPTPGGETELAVYVGREFSRLMDRTRPLWELHLIEGLSDDRVGVLVKMHHALVDGMAAVGIAMILMDLGPEPTPIEPPDKEWQPQPYALSQRLTKLASSSISSAQRMLIEGTSRVLDMSARSAASDLRQASEVLLQLVQSRSAAPTLPFNGPISANRSYAFTSTPFAGIKAVSKVKGGTVNDVILAAVSGMLASYLRESGVAPERLKRDPVALVPVSVRREGDPEGGNRVSVVFVDLPVAEPDPARRITLLSERMNRIKGSAQVAAGSFLVDVTGFAPPLLSSSLASLLPRIQGQGPACNLVVSNVPGPPIPLYLNGSRVLATYPVVPLNPADQGLNVGVLSYNGTFFFGISTDRALDPPAARVAAALDEAIADLVALAD